ncbi:MAG: hypothetical protein R3222_07445, partial [Balneolaceae bacterium]|nr:hypothetical protein [Balneolaceae bacterium]
MKITYSWAFMVLLLTAAIGCGNREASKQQNRSDILDEYFDAFNRHDVDGLTTLVSDDIMMMSLL